MRTAEPSCSFLPVLQRDCARARVRVHWYYLLCTQALTSARLGLVDGEDLIRTKWASNAPFLPFLRRFYTLTESRSSPEICWSEFTHTCVPLASECRCYLFRFWGSHWWLFSSLLQRTHHLKKKKIVKLLQVACKLGRSGPARSGCVMCRLGWQPLRGRRLLGRSDHSRRTCAGRLQAPRKRRLLIEQAHLTERGESGGWRGGKVWANVVVRTSQPLSDSWGADAARRVTDSEQKHPGAGMKHASAWVWRSSSKGCWCMYGITHELIHFFLPPPLHHVQEFFRVMMTAVETWQLSCSAWTNRKTQATLQHTRTYVEICHRGALSRHHGTVTGGARGGCLCSLRSVCRLDLSSCDILSHGCCYREWADQTEETSTGATLRPTLDQPTEEEPQ